MHSRLTVAKARTWEIWVYVDSFHDGDTFYGYASLGANVYLGNSDNLLRFRCARINAPELSTGKPGSDATDYANKIAPRGKYQATSTGLDNYGRPLLDLHLASGLFSDAMLTAGMAIRYA